MKRKLIALLALTLACLMILAACGGKPGKNNGVDDPNQQQGGSSGEGGGAQSGGGSGDPDNGTDPGDMIAGYSTLLGKVDGVSYWTITFDEAQPGEIKYVLCAGDMAAPTYQKLFETAGDFTYAEGSLEGSDNTALYFTASQSRGGEATLYCYDLYNQEVQQVLAAPCSNMVVFGGVQWDRYGWILQQDYVMAIDLESQMADMTQAVSTAELSGFSTVGGSFFGPDKTASIQESEYGVLEITLTVGSTLQGYLYTCDTFTAVALK